MSNEIQKFAGRTFKTFWLQVLGIAVLIAVGIALVKWITNTNSVSVNVDQRIDVTPQQVQSIQSIGQWEFLAINDEELVDTVRKSMLCRSRIGSYLLWNITFRNRLTQS